MGSVRKGCAPAFKAHSRNANRLLREAMGQASRTTKLLLDLGKRTQGGANTEKRAALAATVEVLNAARAFYIDFFLAHADKLSELVSYYSQEHLEWREG